MSAAVSAPAASQSAPDPSTGFFVMQQQVTLAATTPLLADGSPLTYPTSSTGPYTIDVATAKAGFVFGALLYQISTTGAVSIYNGSGGWIPEASFAPAASVLKPALFSFKQSDGTWSGTFMLSTLPFATDTNYFPTQGGGKPLYGFIAVFATPKPSGTVVPTTAVRSPLGAPFGVSTASNTSNVQPGLLSGSVATQDATSANGFAIMVKNAAGKAAELIVSGDPGLSQMIVANLYSGGTVQASIALCNDNTIALASSQQVTIAAPIVTLTGTLQAQNIEYVPYGGSSKTFL